MDHENIYGIEPGETFWAASDVGWVVGHSYIVYAPLLHGATTCSIEGKPVGTPDAGAFWRVIAEHGVAALFTAPTAFRAIKKEDPQGEHIGRYDCSRFRTLFLAGERADPDTIKWAEQSSRCRSSTIGGRRRRGWPIAAQSGRARHAAGQIRLAERADAGLRPRASSTTPASRSNPARSAPSCVKLPLPPSCLPTLWNNDERFRESYLVEFPRLLQDRRCRLSSTRTAMSS